MNNPRPFYNNNDVIITNETTVHKTFGMLLHGTYDITSPNKIKFLTKYPFYNLGHDEQDRICYAINKDRTKMIIAGWHPCPRYLNDGMDEVKGFHYIDVNTNTYLKYVLPGHLNSINYKNIAFDDTNRVILCGMTRENKEEIIIQYADMNVENISSMQISSTSPSVQGNGEYASRFTIHCGTGRPQNTEFLLNIDDKVSSHDMPFSEPLPIKEMQVTTVQQIIDDYGKGKIQTEGMEIFLEQNQKKHQKIKNITYSYKAFLPYCRTGFLCGICLWIVLKYRGLFFNTRVSHWMQTIGDNLY